MAKIQQKFLQNALVQLMSEYVVSQDIPVCPLVSILLSFATERDSVSQVSEIGQGDPLVKRGVIFINQSVVDSCPNLPCGLHSR